MTTTEAATRAHLTTKNKIGLGLAGLLGLIDVVSVGGLGDSDGAGPPLGVLIAGSVIGLITIIAVIYTWRTGNRLGARIVAGTRILSILSAVPAFFVDDVPAGLIVVVAVAMVITVVTVALVLSRPKPELV